MSRRFFDVARYDSRIVEAGTGNGPAESPVERLINKRNAQQFLAELHRHERIVESCRDLDARDDLPPAQIERLKAVREMQYKDFTGIDMAQRDELRARLERILEHGNGTVAAAVQDVRRGLRKRMGAFADGASDFCSPDSAA